MKPGSDQPQPGESPPHCENRHPAFILPRCEGHRHAVTFIEPNLNHSSTRLPASSIWLAHWIFFGAACNVAGWSLSAVHQLHAVGLAIAIPLIWCLMAKLSGLTRPPLPDKQSLHRGRHRFTKLFPAAFLLLAVLCAIALHRTPDYS